MIIPNYEIIEKIAESPQATIYKAYHKKNPDRLLVLKVMKTDFLSEYKKSQIMQKIEHLRVLSSPLVITPILFSDKDENYFITQDHCEGITLDKLLEIHSKISLNDFFTIAIGLASALEKVHEAGIIHGGIKPHNILVDPGTLDIRLIDFISAFDVRDVSHFIYDRSFVRETLSYTSPEHTGRISHRVVFSSDLYSLGIVFYEMLVGSLPFSSTDPLELIHSHLAQEASRVNELNPEIPTILSNIVAKLMFKEPEKRYQSASGLLADLLRCRDEYAITGAINEFPLESCAYTRRVIFISKMVGRDKEAKIILEEYERVAEGDFRSMLISGLPGIGKTRLIQELQKPIVKHRGYFTSGKFDIYQKNIPYSSLIQAFRNLMRTFLTESDERVVLWKDRILNAVGQNGKILTDVIPELEVLIGPQPEVKQLPPVESLHRFHDLFDRFLGCLASEENPLTLFIDDLQWCDVASFDFLANIFANYKDHPNLFLLGAYRHNEVDSSHPLSKLVQNAKEGSQPLKEIRLGPLKPEHCREMVSYILDSPPPQTKALSDFVSALSEGNPLFVSESLSYLYNEDLLFLDEDAQWRWDMDKISQSSMPITVVALFSAKIRKLPPDLITLLEYCACMGNIFSPAELSLIREMTLPETFDMLKPALEQGLLVENKNQLQFVHDRVQEAALSSIPAERRRQIHWQVGNRLLAAVPESTVDIEELDNLFTTVSHLNLGRASNPDAKTAYFLSDVNYHAGNKALDSLATEAANEYFNLSRELLPDDCWEDDHYECTFRIFQKAAKTELMCGNYRDSEKLLNYLLDHAKTDLDKAECLAEQTTSLSSIGNFAKAIETANRGLAYFGKAIPENLEEVNKRREELVAEIAAKDIDIRKTILDMPFATDRKSKVESAFYSELLADLYLSGRVPELYLIAAQATLHCLSSGMDEALIYAFTAMAIYFAENEEFTQSFIYEDLTRDLAAKFPNTFAATKCMTGRTVTLMHSRSHPKEIVDHSLKAIQCGKNCGDLSNAGYSYGPLMWNLQVQGADLPVIEEYIQECLQFSNRYHLSVATGLAEAMQAGWVEPMKKGYLHVSVEEKLSQWERDNHAVSLASYYIHRALTHYYFGEHEKAERCLIRARNCLPGMSNSVLTRQWRIFSVLNALKLYEERTGFASKSELMAEIRPIIEQIERWAALGPSLRPYLDLLYAELERVTGEFKKTRSLYLDAINTAHEQEYTFLEGYLNECLGGLLLKEGQPAKIYFAEAARLYKKCGAERKEIDLIERNLQYFEEERTSYPHLETEFPSSALPDLDIEYLIKSCFSISAEIEQEALLKKIMNVVIEYSGAEAGYLLIEEGGNLFIRAESHATDKETVKTFNKKLEDANDVCKAIVRYVHRTGEQVILNNAAQEGVFKENLEVQDMQLRSVLCLPVIKQSKMVGVLYLENRLSDSVFVSGKTDMLELLVSQAVISLENAALFSERKKAEELKLISKYNRSLIEASLDPLVTIGPDGKITDVNKATELVTGYSREELIGTDFSDYFTKSEKAREGYQHAFQKGLVRDYPLRIQHKDRHITPVLYNASVYRDESGEIIGVFAAARDVTELKKAEEKIQTLANAVESSDDAIVTKSLDGIVTSWNKGAEQIYGYLAEEILGKPISILEPDNLKGEIKQLVKRIKHGEKIHHYETLRLKKDGTKINISITISPVFDASGELVAISTIARDITERKKAEEALRLSNIYNRSLIEASLDPLVTIGPDGKITDVNEATELVTDYSRSELIGTDFTNYFTEPEKAKKGYQEVFREGLVFDYELEIRSKKGRITPVLYNASIYKNEVGEVIGVFAAARDITERKKAEESLREAYENLQVQSEEIQMQNEELQVQSEELNEAYELLHESEKRFRTLTENSPDVIARFDRQNRHTYANPAAAELYGYSQEEITGKTHTELGTDPELVKLWESHYENVFTTRKAKTIEFQYTLPQGKEYYFSTRIVPEFVNDDVTSVLAISRDITYIKEAEEALRLSNIYNRSLIEANLDPLVTIGPDGKIMDVNDATEQVTGYSRNDLIGTDFSDYFIEPEKARTGYQRVFTHDEVRDYPLEIQHKNGQITPVLYNASVYTNENGRVIGVFAAARDITEIKKAEETLKSKLEELARSNAELEQFAYIASHDLQEPLRIIASYLQLLQRRYQGQLDDKADKYIHFSVDAASRMQGLINDLLEISRVTTRAREPEPTDCEFILNQVLSNLELFIKENKATVSYDPLPKIMADYTQLAQVFQNLIVNGIKFRGEEAPKIHISAEKKGDRWLFSVQDNGIGIDPKYSEKIFEIFKRLHKKEEYAGTGIGLSICKKIVERHGGHIWAESELDKGSIFYFTLPINPREFQKSTFNT